MVHCGVLHNVVKRCGTLVEHSGALQCIAETSQNISGPLPCATDLYGSLQWFAETLQKACRPLWCFMVHALQLAHPAVECMTYQFPFGIIAVRYGSLADHWNISKPLWFISTDCGASSACRNGVNHTLTVMPKCHPSPLQFGNLTKENIDPLKITVSTQRLRPICIDTNMYTCASCTNSWIHVTSTV